MHVPQEVSGSQTKSTQFQPGSMQAPSHCPPQPSLAPQSGFVPQSGWQQLPPLQISPELQQLPEQAVSPFAQQNSSSGRPLSSL